MNALNFLLTLGALPFLQNGKKNEVCDFDCWIRSLVIHVPPITETFLVSSTINLTNMIISNISFKAINASFYPNEYKIEDGILFNVTLSASLVSDLKLTGLLPINGNFSVAVSEVCIKLPLKFIKDSYGLISNVTIYDDKCSVTINNIDLDLHLDSLIIDDIFKLLHDFIITLIKNNAGTIICNSIKPKIKQYGSNLFGFIAENIRPYFNGSTPIDIPIDSEKMSNLKQSQIIDLLRFVLTNLTNSDGPLNLNNLINRFSDDTGIFDYYDFANYLGLPLQLSFEIPIENDDFNSTIYFTIKDIILSNLNTWKDLTIIDPISPFVLDTHTSLENLGINLTFEINASMEGVVDSGKVDLSETAFICLDMQNNSMDFQLQFATEKGAGLNYSTAQCIDLDCLMKLASPEGTGFKKFEFNTSIGDIEFGSPEDSLEESIQAMINTIFDFFISNYREQIPVFLNGFINEFGTNYINQAIKNTLRNTTCDDIKDPLYHPFGTFVTIIALGFWFISSFFLVALILIVKYLKNKKINEREENITTSGITNDTISISTSDEDSGNKPQIDFESQGKFLAFFRDDSHANLFMHPRLPLWLRLLMPILILSNIALFISANGSIGGSVFLKLHFGDIKRLEFPSLFNFSLINSITDMWKAGTYALSILVACMSAIWPYSKLVLMLIVWMIPSSILKKKHRDRILRILDVLGKWSLLDSFFMILMVVGFHFVIRFPIVDTQQISKENILYVWVLPVYGFVGLIVGTIYSLALSHIICYIDQYASKSSKSNVEIDPKSQIKTSVFKEQNLASKIFLVFFLPFALTLFLLGISVKSFSFEFVGFTGWALDVLNVKNKAGYTVIDMVTMFPNSCEFPNNWEVRTIQIVYVITAIITPILHIISLGIMLFTPFTRKALLTMYNVCEVLYAWSCLDVFTLSLLVSMIQITQFTNFMVGHRCDLINDVLKKFFNHEKFIDGHYKCFEVLTVLENGTFLLIAAALINTVSALWINAITRKVLEKDQDSGDYIPVADKPDILLISENYTDAS
ncbi:hypothetical protein M9Y10_045269 [Tritrichomonas musculus]|uniref:Lipid-binding serum glycoprotein N-terminal domain-containing protein n=1 Tax=Tritrichomonas musculus TaxID=1915356 RepID=A0ABR2JV57_9EUKA